MKIDAWLFAVALLAAFLCGCATMPGVPAGYQDDTTPTHNGEKWVGG